MGFLKRKAPDFTIVLPSGREVGILGNDEAISEVCAVLDLAVDKLVHEHKWMSGLVCYQIFHSDPPRYQLMCTDCGVWVDVDEKTFQMHLAEEMHREQVELDKAERDASFAPQPIILLGE
jgi:hypothetical protein